MSWSISTHNIARISSFQAAEKHWADNKPWRAEDQRWRQLGGRRMKHKRLVKLDNGDYSCILFKQSMVTYRPDGGVELTCHDSVSSNAFAWCVRPNGCRPVSHQGWMFWAVMTDDGERFYRQGAGALVLQPTTSDNWLLTTEPDKVQEWKYDPKKGAVARKAVKPYTTWFETSRRLGVELPNYVFEKNYLNPNIRELLENPSDASLISRLAWHIGPPKNALNSAYLQTGARHRVPAPFDRLPRRTA